MSLSSITIGLLSGWPAYYGSHLNYFIQHVFYDIRSTALQHGCNLMIAAGVNRKSNARSLHTAWPILSPDCDFVPVGDWNTNGLIVVNPLSSEERSRYVHKLVEEDFPVVFIGPGECEPAVVIDNQGGIRQAVEHLVKHGHRRLAFIAGDPLDSGDSTLRLEAYHRAVEEFEAVSDPRLVAYGYHYPEGGYSAMERILSTGIAFTAVVCSNDTSAYGAMEMLKAAGRRIPTDVAVIGFDDYPVNTGQIPSMTSVHYPLYDLGFRATNLLLEKIQNPGKILPPGPPVPTWLAIRESCGCSPVLRNKVSTGFPARDETEADPDAISRSILDTLRPNAGQGRQEKLAPQCRELVASFFQGIDRNEAQGFQRVLHEILTEVESDEDHLDIWQEAISVLRLKSVRKLPDDRLVFAEDLLHQARLAISDAAERQCLRWRLSASDTHHQVGWMTTRMFSSGDEKGVLRIFAEHTRDLGVKFEQVVFFEPRRNDPTAGLSYHCGNSENPASEPRAFYCETRKFPTPEILPKERPYALILLPLVFGNGPVGFVAFDAGALELLSLVVRQLTVVLRTLKLHIQAENLSLSDPVTGVHNRRFFELLVKRELNRCRRYNRGLTLILVQFDGWKEYCATKELLHSIPQILKDCVRRNTDVIGRFSSDTFAILLPETDPEGSRNLAEAIRRKVGELEEIRGKIEIHIGITTAEAESRCGDVDTLFYCADRTLNRAKSSGRICEDVIRFAVQKNPNAECASSLQGD